MNKLWQRILEISYLTKSSHIGSCLTSVDIIDSIYKTKKKDEPFILSCAHANLALLVVLEKYFGYDALQLFQEQGVHCKRDLKHGIQFTGGHLGQGITIACGMAIANRKEDVYCLISDGEWYEGSVQESLNFIKENNLKNLRLYCNFNGWSAYNKTDVDFLSEITLKYCPWAQISYPDKDFYKELPGLEGLNGHYHTITDNDWKNANEKGLLDATRI